ncbi:hypothetical protein [Ensifer sp. 4252]|uniref:hypothetical protein n=1 Tax=Ensifer sp. 4252 TaxID=3373915 RepID=UPI003D1CCDD6
MIEMEEMDQTLCDCTIEVAELFASMPAVGVDAGSLLDHLALRLEISRDRLQRPGIPRSAVKDASSERAVQC